MLRGNAGLLLLGAGLVMTAFVLLGRGFDARHPRPEALFYAIDVDQQQGFWVSSDITPDSWLDEFMGDEASAANLTRIMPGYEQEVMILESPVTEYKAASLTLEHDRLIDGVRTIGMRLQSPENASYINILLGDESGILSAEVNGFAVPVPDSEEVASRHWWRWRWYGLPQEGADIVLTLAAGQTQTVRIVEVVYGTPAGAPARPENSMPKPYTWSDSTVIFQTIILE